MEDAELTIDGKLTYASLILFGSRVALGRHLAQSEIIFEYKSAEVAGPAQQRENFREGFFCCYDQLWNLINLRNDKQHYSEGLFVYDIPTFDVEGFTGRRAGVLRGSCQGRPVVCGK